MSSSLEKRDDGSIALFINNDLQFDSKDEHIYHEGLVLPALALAHKRLTNPLDVLIIGGGDGLVARELFKSKQINKVDLVDYDPEILNHARLAFAEFNQGSLADPRLSIHVEDAYGFVEKAMQENRTYDLIISDLTVPNDANTARFHSIEWYTNLASILSPSGLVAINGISSDATPQAFWCVYNSIAKGNLFPRPYRVQIPSFAAKGFGADWAFYLASKEIITARELEQSTLVEPRSYIQSMSHLFELFSFPAELFTLQNASAPAHSGSDALIHYFNSAKPYTTNGAVLSSLSFSVSLNSIPAADTGKNVLPLPLSSALAQLSLDNSQDSQALLDSVLKLMPTLQSQCPPELIEEFVQNPAYFIEGIDLQGLVSKLLQRAQELPAQLVTELELLRDKLQEWAGDHLSLLALGQRVITVLTLVIVIGNVLYPDSVYGKGEHPTAGAHHADGARRGAANGRRGGYVNGAGVNGTYWNNGVNTIYRNPATTNVIREPKPGPAQIKTIGKPKGAPMNSGNTTGFVPNNMTPGNGLQDQSSYIAIVERNVEATKNRLQQSREEIIFQKQILQTELQNYKASSDALVDFGISKIEKAEAVRRTELAIQKADSQIASLDKQILQIPATLEMAKLALTGLQNWQDFEKGSENEPV